MLGLVHVLDVEAEERVGDPRVAGDVREVAVDEEHGEQAEGEPKAQGVEAPEGVERPDDAVAVGVEELAVLLDDGLVRVRVSPAGGALGRVRRGGFVRSRSACIYALRMAMLSKRE